MRATKGFLLSEAVVGFFLLFLTSLTMFRLLATSDRGYAQSTSSRIALQLARESLESVRAGSTPRTVGTQTLTAVQAKLARSTMTFKPTLTISTAGTVLLVRSKVSWSEGRRTHSLELKTYVAP